MLNKINCKCCGKAVSKKYLNSNQIFCCNAHRDKFHKLITIKEVFRLSEEDKALRERLLREMELKK